MGMTSAEQSSILEQAERRWGDTALRARIQDGDRMKWKYRFMARAVTLIARWRSERRTLPVARFVAHVPEEDDAVIVLAPSDDAGRKVLEDVAEVGEAFVLCARVPLDALPVRGPDRSTLAEWNKTASEFGVGRAHWR